MRLQPSGSEQSVERRPSYRLVLTSSNRSEHSRYARELYSGTLENGGVSLAPFHDFEDEVDQEVKDALAEIEAGIVAGDIPTS